MAARYQATYSSTPASVIYAQSWPVPTVGKRYPEKLASNSHRKKLNNNLTWIDEENRRRATTQQASGRTEKTHSWAKSMLKNNYPDWIEEDAHVKLDMAKEFRMTLKMFKNLTQQVEEVQLSINPYSLEHYFNNQDSPGLYRSQLHLAANQRSYTPQPWHNLKGKAEQPRPQSHLGVYSKNYQDLNCIISKSRINKVPSHDETFEKKSQIFQAEQKKAFEKHRLDDERLQKCDSNIVWPADEKHVFGYIDPVPSDWTEQKLEELEEYLLNEKGEPDAFIVRYFRLCRLEAETIEHEKRCLKSEETVESSFSVNGLIKTINGGKKQLKKSCSNAKNCKSKDEKIVKSSEKNFRKCTYFKSDLEYGKSPLKSGLAGRLEREESCCRKGDNKQQQQQNWDKPITVGSRKNKCLSARVSRNTSSATPASNPSVDHYDIVKLASSFEPPSKDRIKCKSRPVTAKSAKSKGLFPGKSWQSQRRLSLTANQTNSQLITSDTSLKSKPAKGRHKSAKRKTKRSASSKL